ncbi:hypothetical protein GUJ93_ZPchr0001g30488 [Zizania palustris]|uniref:Uncharacterized protein n=1 Tax=Zizania palustris TaxID=103762 RepID=A0A8J5RG94_ZIZPA|nr:hypothetical protein GUJ93_ZPchr0001g30488 [Zizania palustris]
MTTRGRRGGDGVRCCPVRLCAVPVRPCELRRRELRAYAATALCACAGLRPAVQACGGRAAGRGAPGRLLAYRARVLSASISVSIAAACILLLPPHPLRRSK